MLLFLLKAASIIFIIGLIQWARSGVILWDIRQFLKRHMPLNESIDRKKPMQRIIRKMETKTDDLLRSSFKLMGVLALCIWFFVIAFVAMDMMGIDWSNKNISANHVLGNSPIRSAFNSGSTARTASGENRNVIFLAMGSNFRR